ETRALALRRRPAVSDVRRIGDDGRGRAFRVRTIVAGRTVVPAPLAEPARDALVAPGGSAPRGARDRRRPALPPAGGARGPEGVRGDVHGGWEGRREDRDARVPGADGPGARERPDRQR